MVKKMTMMLMLTLKSELKIKSESLSNYQQYPLRVRHHCQSNFRRAKKKYYNKRCQYVEALDNDRVDFVQNAIVA